MWMSRSVGVHVFPTQVSERIRSSPALIHYQLPSKSISNEQSKPEQKHSDVEEIERTQTRVQFSDQEPRSISPESDKAAEDLKTLEDIKEQSSSNCMPSETQSSKASEAPKKREHPQKVRKVASDTSVPSQPDEPNVAQLANVRRATTDAENEEQGFEILRDLDNALEEDDQMSFEQLRQKSMKSDFKQYRYPFPTDQYCEVADEPKPDYPLQMANGQLKQRTRKPHQKYMDAEKCETHPSNMSAPVLNDEVIWELKRIPGGVKSLSHYKEERKQQVAERLHKLEVDVERMKREYTPEMFIDQTPTHFKDTPTPIPHWKRLLMAKKIAEEAKLLKEEELRGEFQAWKNSIMPNFKRSK